MEINEKYKLIKKFNLSENLCNYIFETELKYIKSTEENEFIIFGEIDDFENIIFMYKVLEKLHRLIYFNGGIIDLEIKMIEILKNKYDPKIFAFKLTVKNGKQ